MSEALLQLNSPRFVITLRGTEKLKGSPALRVISLRIPGLGEAWLQERSLDYMKGIFLYMVHIFT